MPTVSQITDKLDLVATAEFPYGKFLFDQFNQVQSAIFDVYEKDANALIASATSSGKTAVAEMYIAHEVKKRGGKGMFIAPMRALAQEKIDDWTDPEHHFYGLNLSICTGDYQLTESRKKELAKSDIIIMTSEMLSSRIRNMNSEKNTFLQEVRTIVVDESHLLTVPDRGAHLEVALMKITQLNPNIRVVLLSATLPNVAEISGWLSHGLTGKDTNLLVSDYRPCPLTVHFEPYFECKDYYDNEDEKVDAAMNLVRLHHDDKFLIFTHTLDTGTRMKNSLDRQGIKCEFHHSNLDKDRRIKLVNEFKKKDGIRVLVATSTLAWGCNTPARRVIIVGVHRGPSDIVKFYDLNQELGRAGRPKYDLSGDGYVLLPSKRIDEMKEEVLKPEDIQSQLLARNGENGLYKTLAFHLVAEVHHGGVKTKKDFYNWYSRSLAHYQAMDLDEEITSSVLDSLKNCGAIKIEEDGTIKTTTTGAIASMFYFSPFDVSGLRKNFRSLFEHNKQHDDMFVAVCLANIDSHRVGIVSKAHREEVAGFMSQAKRIFGDEVSDPALRTAACYHMLLNGKSNGPLNNLLRSLQSDFGRTAQVLTMLDTMGCKWQKTDWLNRLRMRVQYGVGENLVYLCQMPHIGAVRAKRLWDAGIKSTGDVAKNAGTVRGVLKASKLGDDKINEVINAAQGSVLQDLL